MRTRCMPATMLWALTGDGPNWPLLVFGALCRRSYRIMVWITSILRLPSADYHQINRQDSPTWRKTFSCPRLPRNNLLLIRNVILQSRTVHNHVSCMLYVCVCMKLERIYKSLFFKLCWWHREIERERDWEKREWASVRERKMIQSYHRFVYSLHYHSISSKCTFSV